MIGLVYRVAKEHVRTINVVNPMLEGDEHRELKVKGGWGGQGTKRYLIAAIAKFKASSDERAREIAAVLEEELREENVG